MSNDNIKESSEETRPAGPQEGSLRFKCGLTNLKLDRTMQVKGFVIEPLAEGQDLLKKASGMDSRAICSATLSVELPGASATSDGEQQLSDRGLNVLLLLFSFTNRARVQSVQEGFERFDGSQWKSIGGGKRDFPALGTVRAAQMDGLIGGVEGFIERNLERLMADEDTGETGITLAMRFLCSNYTQDFIESQYVKTWTAAEILISKNTESDRIITKPVSKKLRTEADKRLAEHVAEGLITAEQIEMMLEKLPEVARKSIARQGVDFYDRLFAGHQEQIPTVGELRAFANIRNGIAHEGKVSIPSDKDDRELDHAKRQLQNLLERTILALLEEEAELFGPHWSDTRHIV